MLTINPNISIFYQLAEYLRIEIFSGHLKPGEKMKSIRDMAVELEVNPNTIKRVYQELIDEGLVSTKGTAGNFVSEDKQLIEEKKQLYILSKTSEYADLLKILNVDLTKFNNKNGGKIK